MRRLAAWLLALAALGGCGKSGPPPLQVAIFAELDVLNVMRGHLEAFSRQEGVQAKALYIPYANYSEKLSTLLAAGQAPDVIWIDVSLFPSLHFNGAFQSLSPRLRDDPIDLRQYYPELLRRFSVDGELYAVPQDAAPIACLYYNKRLFAEAGVAPPKGDWSWAEFLAAAKKLVKKGPDGKVRSWAFMDNYGPDWAGMIYANGGSLVDSVERPRRCLIDQPAAVEALQFLADLSLKHQVSPPVDHRNAMLALGQDEFIAGRVAMLRTGLWITPTLRKAEGLDWDILPFPSGPRAKGGKGRWPAGGSGWAISRDCKRRGQAWTLIKFLSSPASQLAYARAGHVQPAMMKLARSRQFLDSRPPDNKGFLEQAVARAVYSPMHPRWAEMEQAVIAPGVGGVLRGEEQARPALKKMAAKINATLFAKKKGGAS